MVAIHTGQGGLKSFLTEIIGKRSKDGAVLRLDFLVYEKNFKGHGKGSGRACTKVVKLERGQGTSMMVELGYSG